MVEAMEDLTFYRPAFKAAVLHHIRTRLSTEEWQRLRALAEDRRRHVPGMPCIAANVVAEAFVDAAITEDVISVEETLIPAFNSKSTRIGAIDGQSVYYIEGQGVYLWGKEPSCGSVLMVWLTHPAYPPRW